MKKILAIVLCLCMVVSMSATALAADTGNNTTGNNTTGNNTTGNNTTGNNTTGNNTTGGNTTGGNTTGSSTTGSSTSGSDESGDTEVIIPGGSTTPSTPDKDEPVDVPFTDVEEEAYYYEALEWAIANGITTGTTESTFSPKAECTRAQMVTFLWRVAGEPAPKTTAHDFADVDADAYYYNALLWAIEMGITTGTTATTFDPGQVCTRGQMAAFLFRYVGTAGDAEHPFDDVDAEAYYAAAIAWAFANGITTGTTESTFSPADGCTRAQMVTFLYRCFAE